MSFITRFAPSPTGPLHLGHAYSALLAHDLARLSGGQFHLRIEDIDGARSRAHWEAQIYDDLTWLGIDWDGPVLRQSDNRAAYDAALDKLWASGFAYACTCTRRDIQNALSAPQEGVPLHGPDGPIYPRTCAPVMGLSRSPSLQERPTDASIRVQLSGFAPLADLGDGGKCFYFQEDGRGPKGETGTISIPVSSIDQTMGDVVVARRDIANSYHLSVVVDDALQGITHVVRGEDLFEATKIHVILQRALGLPTPVYHHHRLIRDESGKRLAKRDDARAIATYRQEGASPADVRRLVGLAQP